MLYNPSHEHATFPHFLSWLEAQPKDEVYNWSSAEHCACGQYAKSIGEENWVGKGMPPSRNFWTVSNNLASESWTFGALADRVRRHLETAQ